MILQKHSGGLVEPLSTDNRDIASLQNKQTGLQLYVYILILILLLLL